MVVQNGMPDILRAVESLYSVCDEILIVDGGSVDGTLEFLKDRTTIYNLKILERSFDTIQNQRQFLLEQTPKNNWIITIDQDEMISKDLQKELRTIIFNIREPELEDEKRKNPYVIKVPYFTLFKDIKHYSEEDYIEIGSKIFYYDRNLEWRNEYHCEPFYPGATIFTVDGKMLAKLEWCIFHFAWLDPKRVQERLKNPSPFYTPWVWDEKYKYIRDLPDGVIV